MVVVLAIAAEAPPLKADKDGVVRVAGTRVTLDSVVYEFKDGATAEEVAQRYPAVTLSAVYAVMRTTSGARPRWTRTSWNSS